MRHGPSLYVELEGTTLENFTKHFMELLQDEAMLPLPDNERCIWNTWSEEEDTPIWPADGDKKRIHWHIYTAEGTHHAWLSIVQGGTTYTEWAVALSTRKNTYIGPKNDYWLTLTRLPPDKGGFWLRAAHYRSDRLIIEVWEDLDTEPSIGEHLMKWFESNWIGSVKRLPLETAPLRSQSSRGNPASSETVTKYHKLATTTNQSANDIQKQLQTTTRTYYQYCRQYTQEDPIDMEDRAKKIKANEWPVQ